jgi:hypothetical protein
MRPKTLALLLCLLTSATACGPRPRSTPTPPTPTPQTSQQPAAAVPVPKSATCALLSDSDLREVQGEGPTDAQGSEHLAGGLVTSQCFYRLPTFSKSVSLEVVRAPSDAQSTGLVRDYWRQKFQRGAGESGERREREEESKRENANGQASEGGHHEREREEETHTRRVAGVGDAAYWSGGEHGGTLSVLKKDAVIGVSVGGPEDEAEKKAEALAEKVLKHF